MMQKRRKKLNACIVDLQTFSIFSGKSIYSRSTLRINLRLTQLPTKPSIFPPIFILAKLSYSGFTYGRGIASYDKYRSKY